MRRRCSKCADGSSGRHWTYRELIADAERLADALLSRFEPGERIAIWSPNSPEWVIVEFAAALAGMDGNGSVRITGRLKGMIIRGGENIFPAEIESVPTAHPTVAEVAVAFLRSCTDATLDAAELIRHVRRELAAMKTCKSFA